MDLVAKLLLVNLLSPLIMLIIAFCVAIIVDVAHLRTASLRRLAGLTVVFAGLGAAGSLAFTIASAIWYEKTTGFSAGNAPLGWIFIYGPSSMALGQLIALVVWWFKRPISSARTSPDDQSVSFKF